MWTSVASPGWGGVAVGLGRIPAVCRSGRKAIGTESECGALMLIVGLAEGAADVAAPAIGGG